MRSHIDTACAAYHLGRKAQTLRTWASTETGPVRPIRVNGRLAWPVAAIRAILQVSPQCVSSSV
nr:DNA-binding protein [Massilia sp. YIM B02787]